MTEVQVFEGDGVDQSKLILEGPMGEVPIIYGSAIAVYKAWIQRNTDGSSGGGIHIYRVPMEHALAEFLNERYSKNNNKATKDVAAFTITVAGWRCEGCRVYSSQRQDGKDTFTIEAQNIVRVA